MTIIIIIKLTIIMTIIIIINKQQSGALHEVHIQGCVCVDIRRNGRGGVGKKMHMCFMLKPL